MKNPWLRFLFIQASRQILGLAAILGISSSFLVGQQPPSNQAVAPPSSAYGVRNGQQAPPQSPQQTQQPLAPNQQPNLNPQMNAIPPAGLQPGVGSGNEVVTKDPYAANPITPQEQAIIDQVLAYWEKSTADISRFSSKFKRWQYNSSDNFVVELAKQLNVDVRSINTTVAIGEVKYMAPDQGMFKIDRLLSLTGQVIAAPAGRVPDRMQELKEFENRFGEWWLCDGKHVYEYDRTRKKCTKHELPPEMKGSAILDSPMPFVFGVRAEKMKQRYWIRLLQVPSNDYFVVEVYPKLQADAVNYDHVHVYLDRKQFLPIKLEKFNTEHRDIAGQLLSDNREVFEFLEQEKNASLMQKINESVFRKAFIPNEIDKDWEVVEVPFAPAGTSDLRSATIPPAGQMPSNLPVQPRR